MGYFLNLKTTPISKLIARDYHEHLPYSSVQRNIYTHTFVLELSEPHYETLLCHFNKQKQFVMYKREINKNETVTIKKCDGVDLNKGFTIEKCDSTLTTANIQNENEQKNQQRSDDVETVKNDGTERVDSSNENATDTNMTVVTTTDYASSSRVDGIRVYDPEFQSNVDNVTYMNKYENFLNTRNEKKISSNNENEKKVKFKNIEPTSSSVIGHHGDGGGDDYTSKSFYKFVHMMDDDYDDNGGGDDDEQHGDYGDETQNMADYEEDDLNQFIIDEGENVKDDENSNLNNVDAVDSQTKEIEKSCNFKNDTEVYEKIETTESSCTNYYTIDVDILYDNTRLDPVEPLMICMLNGTSDDYEDFQPYISMVYNFDTDASELYTTPVTSRLAPTDEMECRYYRDYGSRMTLIKDDFENARYYKKLAATGFWKKSDDNSGTFYIGAKQYFDKDRIVLKYFISFISESNNREVYDFKHLKSFANSSRCDTTFDSIESYVYPPVRVSLY